MLRKLLFGSLILMAVACKKEQVKNGDHLSGQNEKATNVPRSASIGERVFPEGGVKAIASGPAAPKGAKEAQQAASFSYAPVNFEPNAGCIWKDPFTSETHLLALQLPHASSNLVKWASLGTGWEGSTAMAMDDLYFYVVWKNAVYRILKKQPYAWHPLIPNNGEDIQGIVGNKAGGYLIRGSQVHSFAPWGGLIKLNTPPELIANVKFVAGFRKASGAIRLSVVTQLYELYTMSNETGIMQWSKPPNHDWLYNIRTMTGSNWTQRLYQGTEGSGHERPILEEDVTGTQRLLGIYDYSFDAPLVANGRNVWAMGNVLYKIRTDPGIYKGMVEYKEYGWKGVVTACADGDILVN